MMHLRIQLIICHTAADPKPALVQCPAEAVALRCDNAALHEQLQATQAALQELGVEHGAAVVAAEAGTLCAEAELARARDAAGHMMSLADQIQGLFALCEVRHCCEGCREALACCGGMLVRALMAAWSVPVLNNPCCLFAGMCRARKMSLCLSWMRHARSWPPMRLLLPTQPACPASSRRSWLCSWRRPGRQWLLHRQPLMLRSSVPALLQQSWSPFGASCWQRKRSLPLTRQRPWSSSSSSSSSSRHRWASCAASWAGCTRAWRSCTRSTVRVACRHPPLS